jgi:hypothetical protein
MSLCNNIEILDLLPMIDDTTMDLAHRIFAIKPMAMLLSSFEQVMVVDADAIVLQPPEVMFEQAVLRNAHLLLPRSTDVSKGFSGTP